MAEDFLALSKALKEWDPSLRRQYHRQMSRTVRADLVPLTRARARATLPKRGGLARLVAGVTQSVRVSTGRDPGVRLVVPGSARGGSTARAANRGQVRHPVFGRRDKWVAQQVPPDWFDGPLRDQGPRIARAGVERVVQATLDDIAARFRGGA